MLLLFFSLCWFVHFFSKVNIMLYGFSLLVRAQRMDVWRSLKHIFFELSETSFRKAIPEASNSLMKATDGSIAEENKKLLQFIEEVTTNVDEIQKSVLAEILSRNANVEYLQRYDLNGHTDRETFKKVIPVITYEDIQPDINRIANGDTSPIFCSQPISEFLTRYVLSKCASPSQ